MDNGEEIPGLNEDWTFAGAKVMEWVSGFSMFIIISAMLPMAPGKAMPLLLLSWVGTTFGLALVRKRFPDEERGVRNACMVELGFAPPGIPAPARIQPHWSGEPVRKFAVTSYYEQLELRRLFTKEDETEADGLNGDS